ncbi:hypothetical protein [Microbulbifer halophilus]|uniref:Zinc-finger domain-containing protein n=1 Tax=Microbulbifer halophilus TaxID=453963 RepID=A0ABW5EIY0_9GAMM|nr:hypothetical protein [Microbulbifer halophilus]MCW8128365.1 hypothetical protein [Microbulbifer halophilus]
MNKMDEQLNLWANGRLAEADRRELEKKMAEDPALAREAEFAKALRQSMRDQPLTPPAELGLARLRKAMREEPSAAEQGGEQKAATQTPARKNFWKPVAIAACLVMALQAVLLLGPAPWQRGASVDVAPAAGDTAPAATRLQIVFAPSATAADIRAAVLSVNGSIAAGPSALGVFSLALPEDASAAAAVETLRAHGSVEEVIAP